MGGNERNSYIQVTIPVSGVCALTCNGVDMIFKELAALVAADHPQIPTTHVNRVLRTAFKHMQSEIVQTPAGIVNFAGLGQFRIREVEVDKDGSKSSVRRTMFVIPQPKPEVTAAAE
jgi:nucleoid DNA-binding protein